MTASSSTHPVAIVGAGFSGTMVALQLARRGVTPLLIDRAAARGRGIAYGTRDAAHLLNVPAGRMSAWPDAADDFSEAVGAGPGAFAERRDFGDYLSGQLEREIAAGKVAFVDGEVVSARPLPESPSTTPSLGRGPPLHASGAGRSWQLTLRDGRALAARQLVLATGNGRPAAFAIPGWPADAMVQDPWGAEAGERLAEAAREDRPLLLIGAGLTMVDVVLTLDRLGFAGRVTAVSRRGLTPRAHAPGSEALPAPALDAVPRALSDAAAWLRARGGGNWRGAVDSLRPVSQALWARLDEAAKARFVRHARPWWDVHRHRIAPEAAAVLERWRTDGRLRVIAGRVRDGGGGAVRIALRGGGDARIEARVAVNCTGPAERLADSASPLLQQMLGGGLVAPGALGLGVAVDADCRAGPGLWAMGPLTKGARWEILAVPDIRVQAGEVAERIAAHITI